MRYLFFLALDLGLGLFRALDFRPWAWGGLRASRFWCKGFAVLSFALMEGFGVLDKGRRLYSKYFGSRLGSARTN